MALLKKGLDENGLAQLWSLIKSLLAKKQDALTPGDNITIDGNKISAKDTTYELASTTKDGLMSSIDKSKLNGLSNYTHPKYTAYSKGLYIITVNSEGHVVGATAVTASDITGLGVPSNADMPFVWGTETSYKYAKFNGTEHRVIALDEELSETGDDLGVSADKSIFLDPLTVDSKDNQLRSSIIAGYSHSIQASTSNKRFRILESYVTGRRHVFSCTSDFSKNETMYSSSFIGGQNHHLINEVAESAIVGDGNWIKTVYYSVITGYKNQAYDIKNSVVAGQSNNANADNSLVAGQWNVGRENVLIELGNGMDSGKRSDAFYVTTNGDVFCYGDNTSLNAQIDANTAARHTHTNKEILDQIDDAAWSTVYNQTHTHDNKNILDATTASYTTAEKTKLSGIATGAQKNVQSDWNATSGDAFIKNKPTIPDISDKQDKSTAVTHTANTAVGSATKPVYVAADGKATAITHSINADVPANAKFTDTTYSDATQSAHGLMTAADKKKLDGMDLSQYLPLHGTADKAEALSNGSMRYGWCATSNESATSGYRWFCVGKLPKSKLGYLTEILYLNVCGGYGLFGILRVFVRTNSTGTNVEQMNVTWLTRDTTASRPQFKLVATESDTGVSFELWCYTTARWQQMFCNVISDLNLTGGLYNRWMLETHESADAKNVTTTGTSSVTDVDNSYASKAAALTDSGWQYSTVGVSGIATSSIQYRKQGKIVCVSGHITVSASTASITPLTLPAGYRPPQNIKIAQAVDNSSQDTYIITIYTNGSVTYSGKKAGFFTTGNSYYMHVTYFVD